MAILVVGKHRTLSEWKSAFAVFEKDLAIYHFNDNDYPKSEITYAISWNHPLGFFNQLPNLKVIASLGAGVDHILKDDTIAKHILVTRIVDEKLTKDMADYVLLSCFNFARNTKLYLHQQKNKNWNQVAYCSPNELQVGVLGFGALGKATSIKLAQNNFKVRALAKTNKENEKVPVFTFENIATFMLDLDIVICLLPLTEETKEILNQQLFQYANKPFFLINVARGAHLVEKDLLKALDKGQISGAQLDVFLNEPLPTKSKLWNHPKVSITPHVASQTSPKSVAKQLYDNYCRMNKEETLRHIVNRKKGY